MLIRANVSLTAVVAGLASGAMVACGDAGSNGSSFEDELARLDHANGNAQSVGWKKTSEDDMADIPDIVVPEKPDGSLPRSVDWSGYVPPPGDQGEQGSCASWAAGYAIASSITNDRVGWGLRSTKHIVSPRSLYAEILAKAGSEDCELGADGKDALAPLVSDGAATIQQVPYDDQSCVMDTQPDGREQFKIGGYGDINPPDRPDLLKTELAGGALVLWGANIYDDFQDFKGASVYTGSGTFLKDGEQHAGHMMVLVGYDDDRRAFRVMNSWGKDWGDGGFAWVAYDTFVAMSTKNEEGEYRGEAWIGYALDTTATPDTAPALSISPPAAITRGRQEVDGTGAVVLAFDFAFGAPLTVTRMSVVDPEGSEATQNLRATAYQGTLHLARRDGFQWLGGRYRVQVSARAADETPLDVSGEVTVVPLAHRSLAARGIVPGVLDSSRRPALVRAAPDGHAR